MACGISHHFPDGTKEQYEATMIAMNGELGVIPDGQILHAAGPAPGGWQVVAVHDRDERRAGTRSSSRSSCRAFRPVSTTASPTARLRPSGTSPTSPTEVRLVARQRGDHAAGGRPASSSRCAAIRPTSTPAPATECPRPSARRTRKSSHSGSLIDAPSGGGPRGGKTRGSTLGIRAPAERSARRRLRGSRRARRASWDSTLSPLGKPRHPGQGCDRGRVHAREGRTSIASATPAADAARHPPGSVFRVVSPHRRVGATPLPGAQPDARVTSTSCSRPVAEDPFRFTA